MCQKEIVNKKTSKKDRKISDPILKWTGKACFPHIFESLKNRWRIVEKTLYMLKLGFLTNLQQKFDKDIENFTIKFEIFEGTTKWDEISLDFGSFARWIFFLGLIVFDLWPQTWIYFSEIFQLLNDFLN